MDQIDSNLSNDYITDRVFVAEGGRATATVLELIYKRRNLRDRHGETGFIIRPISQHSSIFPPK